MNVLFLKAAALASMIIDHYGAIFHSSQFMYRIIGRIAFPIYCFLLVEGYVHTGSVKKYGLRLLIFALISEIPFDLAFYGRIGFVHQNIFFTLFIGLAAIYFMEKYGGSGTAVNYLIFAAAGMLSMILKVDYNIMGIIYIVAFYLTRNMVRDKRMITMATVMFITNFMSSWLQQFSLLALPILYFYNGQLGPKNKFLQMVFYAAYPLHLFLFYLMK
ncbi:MAG: TraX family protein [Sedimentibacter sp.]|uniref:TraX family protein n=1 Tax=Sedimentibacter sp. TaxID=1960295 RepID=UPI003159114D